jgi:hypothetical protein
MNIIRILAAMPLAVLLIPAAIIHRSMKFVVFLLIMLLVEAISRHMSALIAGMIENNSLGTMLNDAVRRGNWQLVEINPALFLSSETIGKWSLFRLKEPPIQPVRAFIVKATIPPSLANPKAFIRVNGSSLIFLRHLPSTLGPMDKFRLYHEIGHGLGPGATQLFELFYRPLSLAITIFGVLAVAHLSPWQRLIALVYSTWYLSELYSSRRNMGELYADDFATSQLTDDEFKSVAFVLIEVWGQESIPQTSETNDRRRALGMKHRLNFLKVKLEELGNDNRHEPVVPAFIMSRIINTTFAPFFLFLAFNTHAPAMPSALRTTSIIVAYILFTYALGIPGYLTNKRHDKIIDAMKNTVDSGSSH